MKYSACVTFLFIAVCSSRLPAQVPGDGIPDAYFFPIPLEVRTSLGMASVPAYSLLFDTDGVDVVAFFIGGSDVTEECILCDGMNLPGTDALASTSTWTVGYSAGSTQWIRTNPLSGYGFRGVIGHAFIGEGDVAQPWPADVPPFLDFPDQDQGLFQDPDFCIDRVFEDPSGYMRTILYATDSGEIGHIDIAGNLASTFPLSCVPESGTGSIAILVLGLVALGSTRKS